MLYRLGAWLTGILFALMTILWSQKRASLLNSPLMQFIYQPLPTLYKRLGSLVVVLLVVSSLIGQENGTIQTDANYTPTQLIKDIFIGGDCFEVENIRYSGSPDAIGVFQSGERSINIEKGVILSTGNINNAEGPNVSTRISTDFEEFYPTDNDLETLLDSREVTLEDVVILEFDFTPTTDRIQFQYAFASEEYCDYVGSKFNDVFGFFLSGPGINGPFEKGAENIAFVPGTSDFVAINNINHLTNSEYFVNNVPEGQVQFVPCNNYPTEPGVATEFIEFDGFTTVLTAVANVVPCETYHIKLTIADASDALFDSAVFLKANSFNAGGAAFVSSHLPPIGSIEGCGESYFLFHRTNEETIDEEVVVHYNISELSTATAGEDYTPLPDSIIIPAGELSFQLPIQIHKDDLVEGQEHLVMELESACSCADLSIYLPMTDYFPLTAASQTTSICGASEITITSNIDGGVGSLQYQWNTGDTTPVLQVWADTSTTFAVTVTDACNNELTNIREIEVLAAPDAVLEGDRVVCDLQEPVLFDLELGGVGPWNIEYTINGTPHTLASSIPELQIVASQEGIYQLQQVSNDNCAKQINSEARLTVAKPESAAIITRQPICFGEQGLIQLEEVRGGEAPYQYSIDGGMSFTTDPYFDHLEPGSYEIIVKDKNNCRWETDQIIHQPNEINLAVEDKATITLGETLTLDAQTDLPDHEFDKVLWTPEELVDCPTCLITKAKPLTNTLFELQLLDKLGCLETATVFVTVKNDYQIFLPSAFSPNGDGNNDLFFVYAQKGQVAEVRSFQVVNRWGDLIYEAQHFQPNDPSYGWDGTFNGQMLTTQVLAYFVEITFINGETEVFKGDVTLVDSQ